jgi:hypothetical protein
LIELEIKDTAYTASRTASYIDLHIDIDSEGRRLRTKRYYKRGNFNFPIVNVLFIFSNIPGAALCGVYISQFVRYSRTRGSDYVFLYREFLLTRNTLKQGFLVVNLKSPLSKFYCRAIMTCLTDAKNLCHKSPRICVACRTHIPVLSLLMTYHRGCNKINTMCATCIS